MGWIYLVIAALFEVGWPIGLKLANVTPYKTIWILFALITMAFSGYFLYLAQRTIPIGTAYAVWTGIGTICTFLIGIVFFHDAAGLIKGLGILFIVLGIVILKLTN